MKLLNTCNQNRAGSPSTTFQGKSGAGFTLFEAMIVLAIIGILAIFGIIAGLDSYARYNFHSEADTVAALLQRARSEAINNIGESQYGVYFPNPANPDNIILFKGVSYGVNPSYDFAIAKGKSFTYTNTCGSDQVIFAQLSGNTSACTITISDGVRSNTININNEGRIDW